MTSDDSSTPTVSAGASAEPAPAGWRQVFTDDFTTSVPLGSFPGSAYTSRWSVYDGFHDTSGAGLYSSAKTMSVHDGDLDLYLHSEGGQALAAAAVPLVGGTWGGQVHGRYEVRFRADRAPGYGLVGLLWPDSNTWAQGEVDFPEGGLDGTISAFDHCVGNPSSNCFAKDTGTSMSTWHTATTEWTASGVTFLLDGQVIGTSSTSPSATMHWLLQAGTSGGTPPASSAGHVLVDWVKIWVPA